MHPFNPFKGTLIICLPCSVSVGPNTIFCTEGCTAVIDTGSSFITGPASSVSTLMTTIGAVELAEGEVSFVYFMKRANIFSECGESKSKKKNQIYQIYHKANTSHQISLKSLHFLIVLYQHTGHFRKDV